MASRMLLKHTLYTKNKVEELGFRQSDADLRIFISPTVVLLYYCDDCLLLYKTPKDVDILTARNLVQPNYYSINF